MNMQTTYTDEFLEIYPTSKIIELGNESNVKVTDLGNNKISFEGEPDDIYQLVLFKLDARKDFVI